MKKSRIEIHIITYNEEIMLPFTIAHYKKMFINPAIVLHDNNSTDNTVALAEKLCAGIPLTVQYFSTEGMNDAIQSHIKSQAVINSSADWVLCIDADEECFINNDDLDELDKKDINVVEFEGWNIFDKVASPWDIETPMGVPCASYSKPILIKTGVFNNVTFAPGAHSVILKPLSGKQEKRSVGNYKLLHYKHWSSSYNINRSVELGARQSQDNITKGHSFHFQFPKDVHESYFNSNFEKRIPIIDIRL
jgi:glycosyltransferase involved in cell wall biosynthesis